MNNDPTNDKLGSQPDVWVERALKAATRPSQVTPAELEEWLANDEFVEAYQTAMRTKRVLAEGAHEPGDTGRAFSLFRQAHERRRGRYVWMGVAAAACVAALVYLALPSQRGGEVPSGSEALLYQAVADADTTITIATAGDTVSLAELAVKPQTDGVVNVSGNTIELAPVDYDRYEIISSTLNVPQGKVAQLRLPDGTRVWLNACSSLIYPTDFPGGQPRRVQLKGEAYFDVTHAGGVPFIVDCGGVQTRVLGTEFNIRGYAESQPCVTLVKGSVEVTAGANQLTLQPNQQATVGTDGQLALGTGVDVEQVSCWRVNRFYFDGQTVRDIMIEVGRWYNMDVMIGDNRHISDRLHFRGERSWTIEQLVEQVNMISNAEIRISGNTLIVY